MTWSKDQPSLFVLSIYDFQCLQIKMVFTAMSSWIFTRKWIVCCNLLLSQKNLKPCFINMSGVLWRHSRKRLANFLAIPIKIVECREPRVVIIGMFRGCYRYAVNFHIFIAIPPSFSKTVRRHPQMPWSRHIVTSSQQLSRHGPAVSCSCRSEKYKLCQPNLIFKVSSLFWCEVGRRGRGGGLPPFTVRNDRRDIPPPSPQTLNRLPG